ncbi:hypothetical protein [Serratia sp. MMO-24]
MPNQLSRVTERCVYLCNRVVTLNKAAIKAESDEEEATLQVISHEVSNELLVVINELNKIVTSRRI